MFEDLWKEMEDTETPSAGVLLRRVHPEAKPDLFLGLEQPDARRMLALRVGAEAIPEEDAIPRVRGLETRVALPSGEGPAVLELKLTDVGARDLFTTLAADVAGVVARTDDDAHAVQAWVLRLTQWQRLLQRGVADGLSAEAQRGLYAELWLLSEYLLDPLGDRAVAGWTGPSRASHDFEFESGAVEVKATAGKQHQLLRIASERQLDVTGTPALFLFHLSMDVRQGDGESLPDMVASVRSLLSERVSLSDFETRLFGAGYQDVHARQYAGSAYTAREENFFAVLEGFPRIIEADLRTGVGGVHYSVTVAECKHFAVRADDVIATLGGDPDVR